MYKDNIFVKIDTVDNIKQDKENSRIRIDVADDGIG